jgi:hypothetical protein
MPNTVLTPTQVTREALRILHQKLNIIGNVNRQYDDEFGKKGRKIGEQLKVRLPNKYVTRSGRTLTVQDTLERSVTVSGSSGTAFDQVGVDLTFTSAELGMSIDDFSTRILEPAMAVLASKIESDFITAMYKKTYNLVGTPGSPVNSLATILQARKKLTDYLAPADGNRSVILSTQHNLDLVDALKGLFQSSSQIAEQYREGMMGKTAGFTFFENTLLPRHTVGVATGTPLVNGAQGQNGGAWAASASLVTDGWTNSTTGILKAGDVFTIANVFAVHPETRVSTGVLQQFTVLADANSGASTGPATLTVAPAPIYAGPYQNINAQIADNAAITVVGTGGSTYGQSIAMHKDAFAFVTGDLEMPDGVDWKARENYDGISMRIIRQYSISDDTFPCRVDILWGMSELYSELACRIAGN